jgi:hypothetical protein
VARGYSALRAKSSTRAAPLVDGARDDSCFFCLCAATQRG